MGLRRLWSGLRNLFGGQYDLMNIFLFVLIVVNVSFGIWQLYSLIFPPKPIFYIDKYEAYIQPSADNSDVFTVTEKIIINNIVLDLPRREVNSTNKGFTAKEVSFTPLYSGFAMTLTGLLKESINGLTTREYSMFAQSAERRGYFWLQHPPSSAGNQVYLVVPPISALNCELRVRAGEIFLSDVLADTFYQANGQDVKTVKYLNNESHSWKIQNLEDDVSFSYIVEPYVAAKPLLGWLLGLSSLSQAFVALLVSSLLGVLIIIRSFISDFIKDKLKSLFNKKERETAKTPESSSSTPVPPPVTDESSEGFTIYGPHGDKLRSIKKEKP